MGRPVFPSPYPLPQGEKENKSRFLNSSEPPAEAGGEFRLAPRLTSDERRLRQREVS